LVGGGVLGVCTWLAAGDVARWEARAFKLVNRGTSFPKRALAVPQQLGTGPVLPVLAGLSLLLSPYVPRRVTLVGAVANLIFTPAEGSKTAGARSPEGC